MKEADMKKETEEETEGRYWELKVTPEGVTGKVEITKEEYEKSLAAYSERFTEDGRLRIFFPGEP